MMLFPIPEVYADLVTVAGFKPVVAAEKSPGGFDSLPLPFLALVRPLQLTRNPANSLVKNDCRKLSLIFGLVT